MRIPTWPQKTRKKDREREREKNRGERSSTTEQAAICVREQTRGIVNVSSRNLPPSCSRHVLLPSPLNGPLSLSLYSLVTNVVSCLLCTTSMLYSIWTCRQRFLVKGLIFTAGFLFISLNRKDPSPHCLVPDKLHCFRSVEKT